MTHRVDAARLAPTRTTDISGDTVHTAIEVSEALALSAADRDRDGLVPYAEITSLRNACLLDIVVSELAAGRTIDWPGVLAVVRTIARGDSSIAHLLGYHYAIGQNLAFFGDHDQMLRLSADSLRERWFWAAVDNPLDADLIARWERGRLLVSGRKNFATGALLADRVMLSATLDGAPLVAVIPADREGFSANDDWDNMGQRATASGSVLLADVEIAPEEVLGQLPPARGPLEPFATLVAPVTQIVLVNVFLGAAEGALADALQYTRTKSRPWPSSGLAQAAQDPYILARYGELTADLDASLALANRAALALQGAIELGAALTEQDRAEAAIQVYSAKVNSTRVSLEVTSKVFELMGARSTAARFAFDRRWRDVRTLTLHDPVIYKAREVGEHALTGKGPQFSLYS